MDSKIQQQFEQHRGRLMALAYRMLGSVADAEDAVQDTFIKWQKIDGTDIAAPEAWLVTACSRRCIDMLREARRQRETYVGPWLPEPVLAESDILWPGGSGTPEAPDAHLEAAESLTMSFMLLLERLSPAERAAFLLHDVFDYPFDQVAAMVGKTPAACRKLAERARAHVRETRPRFKVKHQDAYRILGQLFDAARKGDLDGVTSLLSEEAELWSDGGGKVVAARRVLHGAPRIAHFLCAINGARKRFPYSTEISFREVSGMPGAIAITQVPGEEPRVEFVLSLELHDGQILKIHNVRNPDKLAHIEF